MSAAQITSADIFDSLYDLIAQGASKDVIYREFGGSAIYIPSYKTTIRNEDIVADYKNGMTYTELRKKYALSQSRIYEIINASRQRSLFS